MFCGYFINSHIHSFDTIEDFIHEDLFSFIRLFVLGALMKYTKKYLSFIFFLTVSIIMFNAGGLALYSFSATSYVIVTLILSFIANYIVSKLSIIFQKIYFFSNFMPMGSPREMGFLLVFIELVSWISRIFSLAIRLFANITAGHILLKILSGFSIVFFFAFSIYIFLIILPNLVITTLVVLESAISLLQTYVFISLVVMYLGSVYGGH